MTTPAAFKVTLSGTSSTNMTVYVSTADGTATASTTTTPGDYTPLTDEPVMVLAGQTTATFNVAVLQDTIFEGTEDFTVKASLTAGAATPDATTTGTIADDEATPTVKFDSATYTDDEDTTTASTLITVTLSGASQADTVVSYSTANGATNPATGGATCVTGVDYQQVTNGTFTIAANSTTGSFTVPVCSDVVDEEDETVALTLTDGSTTTVMIWERLRRRL